MKFRFIRFTNEVNSAIYSSFVSIGNGKYYFFKGSIFSKKAFIVSSKEKREIEEYLNGSMVKLGGFGALSAVLSSMHLAISLAIILFFGGYLICGYLRLLRVILHGKKVVIVTSRSLSTVLTRQAAQFSYRELLLRLLGLPAFFIGSYWFAQKAENNPSSLKLFFYIIVIVITLIVLISLTHLFFKIKLSFFPDSESNQEISCVSRKNPKKKK